ncbi:replication initiation protein [uncultured Cetobacterium sp.]|uniref:replication initiation protein n=1 Tax=uncultured Cetobacterium sp. TaxID=527638 RepID=UPI00261C649B|nr:replication initiation protein [uncultured Cetobacterium sp.]
MKKSYQVVTARMSLDANEQNLLTLLVRELKLAATSYRESVIREAKHSNLPIPKDIQVNPDDLPSVFEFRLSELSEVMGVSNSALSQTLDETTTKMMQRVITWPLEKGGFEKEQLLGRSKYFKHSGVLSLQLHPRSKIAILEETRGVSIIDLKLSLTLKGGYEKRILDMLSMFKDKRNFEVEFSAFQEMVGAKVSDYKAGLDGFRKVVLNAPLKRIFKASDGVWEPLDDKGRGYELIKSGRTVKKIVFKVKYSNPELAKNISKQESLAREKLVEASNMDIAELQEMEAAILEMSQLDTFARISISGYQATSNEYGYQIPDEVMNKIKILTGK